MKLTLLSGPHCSLCDQAKDLVHELDRQDVIIEEINVRDSVDLYHVYGARIPVLKRADNQQELGWVFDIKQLEEFLK